MNSDTSPHIQKKIATLMKRRSGEERLKMGFSMFDSAVELILSSLQGSRTVDDVRKHVFLRLYGRDFSFAQRENILKHLQRSVCVDHDLPMVIRGAVSAVRSNITRQCLPACIILYGSWAKGTACDNSDVDLMVVFTSLSDRIRKIVDGSTCDDIDGNVTIIPASLEDFIKERLPLFTAVKKEGKILFGNVDMSANPSQPAVKYAKFFKQSCEFESRKVEIAKSLLKDGFYEAVPVHCFMASKHAIQAALAMRGEGYSSKVRVLLPLAREYFGEEIASSFRALFDIYTRSEYELDDVAEADAKLAIKCADRVLEVYKGSLDL